MTPGEIAFNAYAASSQKLRSLTNYKKWADLPEDIRDVWEVTAKAVENWTRNQQTCSCSDKSMFGMRGWDD